MDLLAACHRSAGLSQDRDRAYRRGGVRDLDRAGHAHSRLPAALAVSESDPRAAEQPSAGEFIAKSGGVVVAHLSRGGAGPDHRGVVLAGMADALADFAAF